MRRCSSARVRRAARCFGCTRGRSRRSRSGEIRRRAGRTIRSARASAASPWFVGRPGGRSLLHHREITYSVTAPAHLAGSLRESYGRINRLLVGGLRRLGVSVEIAVAARTIAATIRCTVLRATRCRRARGRWSQARGQCAVAGSGCHAAARIDSGGGRSAARELARGRRCATAACRDAGGRPWPHARRSTKWRAPCSTPSARSSAPTPTSCRSTRHSSVRRHALLLVTWMTAGPGGAETRRR